MAIRFQTKTTNFQWQCFQSDDDSQIFTNESKLVGNHQTSRHLFFCLFELGSRSLNPGIFESLSFDFAEN